jgi:hypothetical protein
VHCHRPGDYWREHKDQLCRQLGLPTFDEHVKACRAARKPWKPTMATYILLNETIRICGAVQPNGQLIALLANDTKLACYTKEMIDTAALGISESDWDSVWESVKPRMYTAEERAEIHGLSHEACLRLGLRMSGCADKTPEERRKANNARHQSEYRERRKAEAERQKGISERIREALEADRRLMANIERQQLEKRLRIARYRSRRHCDSTLTPSKYLERVSSNSPSLGRESHWIDDSPVEEAKIQNLEPLTSNWDRARRKPLKSRPQLRPDSGLGPPGLARRPLRWPHP